MITNEDAVTGDLGKHLTGSLLPSVNVWPDVEEQLDGDPWRDGKHSTAVWH